MVSIIQLLEESHLDMMMRGHAIDTAISKGYPAILKKDSYTYSIKKQPPPLPSFLPEQYVHTLHATAYLTKRRVKP